MRPSGNSLRIPITASATGDLCWLLLIALVLFSAGLGLRDPWPADEPRFALMAREMVNSGHWFIPRLGGELYADKPPVFIWLQALFYALTGSLRVAFLLPNLLAGLGTLTLVYDLARRLWDRRVAMAAGLLLLATFQFVLQSRSGQIDGLVTFWICLGLYGLLRHMLLGPHWGLFWMGCFAAGMGVITKGVGFLALFMLIPYWLARRQYWGQLADIPRHPGRWWAGGGFFLLAIGLWAVPMIVMVTVSTDPAMMAYRDNILLRQTVVRYSDTWHHVKPFWYYFVEVIPLFWLPVTALLPWLVPHWRRAWTERDARIWLPLAWIVLLVIFFSFSPGKRGVYLTPAVPMLALACAPFIDKMLDRTWAQRTIFGLTALFTLLFAGLYLAHIVSPSFDQKILVEYQMEPWNLFLAVAIAGFVALAVFRPARGFLAWAAFVAAFWLCYGWIGYPLINDSRSSRQLMEMVRERVPENWELGLVGWHEQTLLQAGRPVYVFGYRVPIEVRESRAAAWLKAGEHRLLLVDSDRARGGCFDLSKGQLVAHQSRSDWYLVDASAIDPSCKLADKPVGAVYYGN